MTQNFLKNPLKYKEIQENHENFSFRPVPSGTERVMSIVKPLRIMLDDVPPISFCDFKHVRLMRLNSAFLTFDGFGTKKKASG